MYLRSLTGGWVKTLKTKTANFEKVPHAKVYGVTFSRPKYSYKILVKPS